MTSTAERLKNLEYRMMKVERELKRIVGNRDAPSPPQIVSGAGWDPIDPRNNTAYGPGAYVEFTLPPKNMQDSIVEECRRRLVELDGLDDLTDIQLEEYKQIKGYIESRGTFLEGKEVRL